MSRRFYGRAASGLAVLSVAVLCVSACSSSNSSSQPPANTGSGSGGASTSGTSSNPTGSPIKIMTIGSFNNDIYTNPQLKTGVSAQVKEINAAGGVGGHPLQVDFCDDQLSPNGAIACANQAVSDKVVAVVGAEENVSNAVAILHKAGIPDIGNWGTLPPDYTDTISFPLAGGSPGWYAGVGKALITDGKKNIAIIKEDNASADNSAQLTAAGVTSAGGTVVRTVVAPAAQVANLSAQATAAIQGNVDGVALVVTPPVAESLVRSLRQAGFTGPISALAADFGEAQLNGLGSLAGELLAVSQVAQTGDTANPEVAKFLAAMKAEDPSQPADEIALIGWTAVDLFAQVAGKLKSITAATVLDAFTHLSTPIDLGTTQPYVVVGSKPPASYPRLFNPTVTFAKLENGKFVQLGGYENPFVS
jgi:branched-chain amino acid transport system substrate-binding protein